MQPVGVGVGAGVLVGSGVAVGVGTGVFVGVAVGCAVAVGSGVGVKVAVGAGVGVNVRTVVMTGVNCGVGAGSVLRGEIIAKDSAEPCPSVEIAPTASTVTVENPESIYVFVIRLLDDSAESSAIVAGVTMVKEKAPEAGEP